MLGCVVNVSEGRSPAVLGRLEVAGGDDLLDLHHDRHHHRAVLTLVGEDAPRAVARAAVELIDLRRHHGAHPRLGAVDVVPFVPLDDPGLEEALAARDRYAAWAGEELRLPAFVYGGDGPTLPEVRRRAFRSLRPDAGPSRPHPTAGAVAAGARTPLVAYNLWLRRPDLAAARELARSLRGPSVRALGLAVGGNVQVSLNLVAPAAFGPDQAYDAVAAGAEIARAELVGLVPDAVLRAVPAARWATLDLDPARTIEARLERRRR